jgi:alpha-2-macroglobulin
MTPPASYYARSGHRLRFWLKLVSGWLLLSMACSLPAIPFISRSDPFTAGADPTPSATLPTLPTSIPQIPPTLIETRPLPGSSFDMASGLTLYFNQPMDRASVESALIIDPQVEGEFTWPDEATLQFLPAAAPGADTFQVRLDSSARAQNGLAIITPPDLTFRGPGQFEMIEAQPAQNARNVSVSTEVIVTFNQPVVPLSAEQRSEQPAFTLEPEVPGRGEWINTSTYAFYPEPALAGGVEYTVTLNPSLTATTGAALTSEQPGRYSWRFRTASPRLVDLTPVSGSTLLLDEPFSLVFNQPMNTASVEENFSLLDGRGNPVEGIFEWQDRNTYLTFTPSRPLNRASTYALRLLSQSEALGGTPLGASISANYTTFSRLALVRRDPEAGEQASVVFGISYFSLEFNAPLADGPVSQYFQIDPPVKDLNVRSYDYNKRVVHFYGPLTYNTQYTLTVSGNLPDQWGQIMGQPLALTIATTPAQPTINVPMLSEMWSGKALFVLPDDAQLVIEAINLSQLDIRAASINIDEFLALNDYERMQAPPEERWDYWQQPLDLASDSPEVVEVPLSPNGVTLPPGLYAVQLDAPEMAEVQYHEPVDFVAVVSPIQMVIKRGMNDAFIWMLDVETNQPVPNASVTFYDRTGNVLGDLVTGDDGTGKTTIGNLQRLPEIYAVTGEPGNADFSLAASTWNRGVNPWLFGFSMGWTDHRFGYAYTDRPIYMPGQSVHYRILLHHMANSRYFPSENQQVSVKIYGDYSPIDGEQPLMAETTLDVSVFGSAAGEFQLPPDAPPGIYTLRIDEAMNVYVNFKVAEYRKPEIDLSTSFNQELYRPDDEIVITIDARYFFGAPVQNQMVHWTLYPRDDRQYMPGGYQTGARNIDRGYTWYENYYGSGGLSENTITDADGRAEVRISASQLEILLDTGNPRVLTFEATVYPDAETPVSAHAEARLHPADFLIGVRPENYAGNAGQELGFSILTSDLQDQPSGGHALQARFQKVTWPEQDEDELYTQAARVAFEPISSSDFQTGRDGRARLAFTPPDPGLYQLEVTGDDAITQVLLWTGGEGDPTWPRLPDQHILLQSEKPEYRPGETAQVFVPNPFGAGAQALVTVERGEVMRSEVVVADNNSMQLAIPVLPEDAPNVYISVILSGYTDAGLPDFRLGIIELTVDPAAQLLQVALIGNPERTGPGGEVTFTLQVNDSEGQPVEGEFSLALVDKAVLALAKSNAASITEAYYGRQPIWVSTGMSLAAYTRRINMTAPDAGGRGGGPGSEETGIRSKFEDTAYWNGAIQTDPDGQAEVTITLPDNLTTWVALVRGLDRDFRVGEAEIEVVATKALLVRPQAPRFLVAGDRIALGAFVHNNTSDRVSAEVRLEADGFELDNPDRTIQKLEIPAGGQRYVTWHGAAQPVDAIDLVFSVQAGELRDAATPEFGALPVLKYSAPSTYGTAGVLADAGERLEVVALPRTFTPTGGSLRVELSPSLAAAILEELQVQRFYPTEFTEAVLSSFLPNLQALQALRSLGYSSPELEAELETRVAEGTETLVKMQNEDGGWGITPRADSNTHITAYVLFGLVQAHSGGQDVEAGVLERARTYLLTNIKVPDAGTLPAELDRLAFQNFALQQAGVQDPALQRLVNFSEDMSPWARSLLALTLAGNDRQDTRAREILMGVKDAVRRSSSGVHWEDRNASPALFCTPTYNNAVVIYALAKLDPASPILPDAVRYLLSARRPGGSWASTYETAWSLLALTQTLQGTADVQANYAYSVVLDGRELTSGKAEIGALEPVNVEVSLDQLRADTGSALRIRRESGSGRLYYRSFLQLYNPVETAEPVAKGIHVERRYYLSDQDCKKETCIPQDTFEINSEQHIIVRLTLTVPETMHYLVLEDFIPAGSEIIDTALLTTQWVQRGSEFVPMDPFEEGWNSWVFGQPKIYHDRAWWVAEQVPPGTYEIVYRLQPRFKGEFQVLPAHAYQYYFPDVEGTSGGGIVSFR